jgi:DNA-binding NarL/FixJ family response regulator
MNPPSPSLCLRARRRIFVVDDHPLVRESLSTLIGRQEDLCVCGQAERSGEAFEAISRLQPDVVIVDLSLQGESGLELIKQLQNLTEPPRILVLSMHDEMLYGERALRAGALGYVMKRATTGKVIEGIRQVLRGRLFMSEALAERMAARFVGKGCNSGESPLARLSDREIEVFQLLGQGVETRIIAESLHLSQKTVQVYCGRIKEKLGLDSFTLLISEAVRWYENENRAG